MAQFWEKSYPSGVVWDAPLPPPVPLESLLETAATRWPDRIALDFYDRTVTFRELHDLVARAAKGLQAAGVGPGVHVGLHLPNTPHFIVAFFGVLMAGGRVVNFSLLAAPRELAFQIADAETKVMITLGLPMLYPQIAALKGTGKFDTLVVCSIADFLRPGRRGVRPGGGARRRRGPRDRLRRADRERRRLYAAAARSARRRGGGTAIYRWHHRTAERGHAHPRQFLRSARCLFVLERLGRISRRKRRSPCCRCSTFTG